MLFFTAFNVSETKATHVAAGDIVVRQIDTLNPNRIEVTIRFYRDCDGVGAPSGFNSFPNDQTKLEFFSPCYGVFNNGFVGPYLGDTLNGNGGGIKKGANCILDEDKPCTEEYLYRDTVDLPGVCDSWSVYWAVSARPGNDNINGQGTFYVQNTFNNTSINTWDPTFFENPNSVYYNNSPVFNNDEPVNSFCVGREYEFDLSATDPDGDSLAYRVTSALDFNGTVVSQVNYALGYTGNDPIPVLNRPVKINQQTGVMRFTPTLVFKGTFAYEVEEWKDSLWTDTVNGIVKVKSKKVFRGTTMRDLRMAFGEFCNDSIPQFRNWSGYNDTIGINYPGNNPNLIIANCADWYIDIPMDIAITCKSLEPNGSDFRITDSTTNPPTIYAIDSAYATDGCKGLRTQNIRLKLFEPLGLPTNGQIVKLYIKKGDDFNTLKTNCGLSIPEFTVIDIWVKNNLIIDLGPEIEFCNPENPAPLLTAPVPGADNYVWTKLIAGVKDTVGNAYTQIADTSGYWGVFLNYKGCQAYDSVLVTEYQTALVEIPDTAFCGLLGPYPLIDMSALSDSGAVDGTFRWYKLPKGDLVSTKKELQTFENGTYVFNVSIPPCFIRDTFVVNRIKTYDVELGPDSVALCNGNQYELYAGYDYSLDSNHTIAWFFNDSLVNDSTDRLMITSSGWYKYITNSVSGCSGADSIYVNVIGQLPPPIISCGNVSAQGKQYLWNTLAGAEGYEVSSNGIDWTDIGDPSVLGLITYVEKNLGVQQLYVRGYSDVPDKIEGNCKFGPAGISPICETIIIVPNVITPNNDGMNDFLDLGLIDVFPGNQLTIYNRWGKTVLDVTNYKNNWSAKDESAGTYFYVLDLNTPSMPVQKGTITVIK